ncbi:UDP-N-acetylmuramoyl-L-alanine--D-glutamate ligase [Piscinibacter sakaiensis]|uniref:UDP-N-acetylmuramoyl-L-alanine--D-glutamate ligase n=1 Tax=Piscinibacter sakaiensis TaxID=1547922 RepID=UPI003AB05D90
MKQLASTSVLILGLGSSGLAMARWCARAGARIAVWDSRLASGEALPNAQLLAQELPQARMLDGALDAAALDGMNLVLKSPGLSPLDDRLAALLGAARAAGVPVQGELDLFIAALADLRADTAYAPKLIAITGTNGKTTTTAMTQLLVASTGRRVAVAGNIGPTMLQTLAEALAAAEVAVDEVTEADAEQSAETTPADSHAGSDADAETGADAGIDPAADRAARLAAALPEVWILELSSFQLDGVEGFAPDAATVLNITEDHLDWHGEMDSYVAAKAGVYGPADGATVMIVNRDDPRVEAMVPAPVAGKGRFAKPVQRQVIRFGLQAPRRPGDFGLLTDNGMVWLARAQDADPTLQRGGKRGAAADDEELFFQRMMPADALRVRGRHNAANALAALALAQAIGCPLAPMLHALRDYSGEPHRLQFVASIRGVDAFDDSKGTNVGATVAAIDGLGSDRSPARLVLILGGDGKGQDFTPLLPPLQRFARAIATLGRDAERVEQALRPLTEGADGAAALPLQRHPTLQAATRWCFEQAQPGDAVLLSPACASLDMFRNYGERGEVFVRAVHDLAADLGEVTT